MGYLPVMGRKRQKPEGVLRQAMADSGLSLNELSRRTGISTSQLSRFMRGERDIGFASGARLMEALGLELRYRKG
jgi:transcriptional regulator with XRE-family HTH domain